MYNSSLFHISCTGAGEWVLESAGGVFLRNNAASHLAQRGAPLLEVSQWDPVSRNVRLCVFSVYDLPEISCCFLRLMSTKNIPVVQF